VLDDMRERPHDGRLGDLPRGGAHGHHHHGTRSRALLRRPLRLQAGGRRSLVPHLGAARTPASRFRASPSEERETKQSTPDAEEEAERGNGAAQPRTHRSSLATLNARGRRRSEGTTETAATWRAPLASEAKSQGARKRTSKKQSIEVKKEANGGARPDGWGCSRRQAAQEDAEARPAL
jgi:hypothetical protein